MVIDYPYLLLALVLLWFPRQWLRWGRAATRRFRWLRSSRLALRDPAQVREPGDTRLRFGEEFSKPRNYIDFFRAMLGGLVLIGNPDLGIESCLRLDTEQVLTGTEGDLLIKLRMALLGVAVLIQFVRYEGRITFYAPIFFLGGLSCALCGFNVGLIALLVAWTLNTAMPLSPAGFLSIHAPLVFMLGLLFHGVNTPYVLFAGVVGILPVIVSLMARRSLAVFTKRMK